MVSIVVRLVWLIVLAMKVRLTLCVRTRCSCLLIIPPLRFTVVTSVLLLGSVLGTLVSCVGTFTVVRRVLMCEGLLRGYRFSCVDSLNVSV